MALNRQSHALDVDVHLYSVIAKIGSQDSQVHNLTSSAWRTKADEFVMFCFS